MGHGYWRSILKELITIKDEWIKLIEELEQEGITPQDATKMIQGYQMIESVMDTVEKIEKEPT